MKIFITGGLGFVGKNLIRHLTKEGHSLTIVDRTLSGKGPIPEQTTCIEADVTRPGDWQASLSHHDAVINLAGVSIFRRWSGKRKKNIHHSRIGITKNVTEALALPNSKTKLLLNASAVGYYGFHDDEVLNEDTPPGEDFLARVCTDWEAAAMAAEQCGVRVVCCRFGVVLGKGGGALKILTRLFKFHIGSRLGSGNQWFSWIHEQDLAGIFLYLLREPDFRGAINCTSPNPVTNRELTSTLNKVLDTRSFVPPAPGFLIRIILGEFGSFIVKGQRAIPERLIKAGYKFKYHDIESALQSFISSG